MPVTCTTEDRVMHLRLSGEIDHHQAKALMNAIDCHVDSVLPRELTLELTGVTFMDSSGIALLLRAHRRMRELNGLLRVTGVPPQAARVLRAAGLHRLISINWDE